MKGEETSAVDLEDGTACVRHEFRGGRRRRSRSRSLGRRSDSSDDERPLELLLAADASSDACDELIALRVGLGRLVHGCEHVDQLGLVRKDVVDDGCGEGRRARFEVHDVDRRAQLGGEELAYGLLHVVNVARVDFIGREVRLVPQTKPREQKLRRRREALERPEERQLVVSGGPRLGHFDCLEDVLESIEEPTGCLGQIVPVLFGDGSERVDQRVLRVEVDGGSVGGSWRGVNIGTVESDGHRYWRVFELRSVARCHGREAESARSDERRELGGDRRGEESDGRAGRRRAPQRWRTNERAGMRESGRARERAHAGGVQRAPLGSCALLSSRDIRISIPRVSAPVPPEA